MRVVHYKVASGKTLDVAGCKRLELRTLRTLSLSLGASLTAVDLSGTRVGLGDLHTSCANLDRVESTRFVACPELTNLGVKAPHTPRRLFRCQERGESAARISVKLLSLRALLSLFSEKLLSPSSSLAALVKKNNH